MTPKNTLMKDTVRPIGLALVFVAFGSLLSLLLEMFLGIKLPRLFVSAITFAFAAIAAFYLFPRILKLPFGDMKLSEYLRRLGFYLPRSAWKHILLGCILAVCTLGGMLIGSLISGHYQPDISTVDLTQTLFSINPALWEEFFFRGVIMFTLLKKTGSLRKAAMLQIVLFGASHIKGAGLWDWIDVLSVTLIAVAFTYTACKTRTLLAGVVFHFLHDAFLFLPQLPGDTYMGVVEHSTFYISLWIMVALACVLVKIASDRLGVKAEDELYSTGTVSTV